MLSGVSLKVALYALVALSHSDHGVPGLRLQPHAAALLWPVFHVSWPLRSSSCNGTSSGCLAYSSLEHVGLICAGIALNTPVTIFGALLHMGYHALTKPVLFFAAGNIHQTFHSLEFRVIGPGVVKVLPVTDGGLDGPGGVAATGLPPFGLFFSEFTVLSGGFAANQTFISVLMLLALLASFCGILQQLTRILLGAPKAERSGDARPADGVPAMALLLGGLLLFTFGCPLLSANCWMKQRASFEECHERTSALPI